MLDRELSKKNKNKVVFDDKNRRDQIGLSGIRESTLERLKREK